MRPTLHAQAGYLAPLRAPADRRRLEDAKRRLESALLFALLQLRAPAGSTEPAAAARAAEKWGGL
jgi:hypothetical protein